MKKKMKKMKKILLRLITINEATDASEDSTTAVTEEETTDSNGTKHRIRSLSFTPDHHLGHFGDHDEARDIHDNFHIHEEGLKNKTDRTNQYNYRSNGPHRPIQR